MSANYKYTPLAGECDINGANTLRLTSIGNYFSSLSRCLFLSMPSGKRSRILPFPIRREPATSCGLADGPGSLEGYSQDSQIDILLDGRGL